MPDTPTPDQLATIVLWGGLLVGLALGAVAQATRFCTMGALADWFTYGGTARLMMWVLAVMVGASGSLVLVESGWLDGPRTVPWSPRFLWLSYAVGGLVFGYGMVLASGCPQRNLVRAGSGSLKAWVTLIVAAVAAQMSLRGLFAVPRVQVLERVGPQLEHPQDLGSMLVPLTGLGASSLRWMVLAALLVAGAVALWRARGGMDRSHWLGGALVGLLVPVAWIVTGHLGHLPEHPETLEAAWLATATGRPEALSFVAPIAHALDLLTLWSDKNTTATYGVMVALGVVLGSTGAALWRKEFHVEAFRSVAELRGHLLGAVMMGFGGVVAMGCSIGQGITGLSMLSAGAVIAVAGIVGGCWLALRVQAWQMERAA